MESTKGWSNAGRGGVGSYRVSRTSWLRMIRQGVQMHRFCFGTIIGSDETKYRKNYVDSTPTIVSGVRMRSSFTRVNVHLLHKVTYNGKMPTLARPSVVWSWGSGVRIILVIFLCLLTYWRTPPFRHLELLLLLSYDHSLFYSHHHSFIASLASFALTFAQVRNAVRSVPRLGKSQVHEIRTYCSLLYAQHKRIHKDWFTHCQSTVTGDWP